MLRLSSIVFLISFVSLTVIHIVAEKLFLYWKLEWFDIPVHILGGVVIVFGIFALHDIRFLIKKRHTQLLSVMLLVFIIAMSWEAYEIMMGLTPDINYLFDTVIDLGMGVIGGLIGYSISMNIKKY